MEKLKGGSISKNNEDLKNIIEDTKEWVCDNWETVKDAMYEASLEYYEKYGIEDEVDIDQMIEDISEKVKQGIMNVIETYEPFNPFQEN